MTTVTAALILCGDRFLICRRRADQPSPLKWEFAGGKIEEGEEPAAGLRRELKEELNIEAGIGPEVRRLVCQYPGRPPILLLFFKVTDFQGKLENRVFAEIRWVPRQQLPGFDFLEADRQVAKEIARGGLV